MAKNNVTINAFENIVNHITNDPVYIKVISDMSGIEPLEIKLKLPLNFDNEQIFIERVANSCFSDDSYYPGVFDITFFITFLDMLTDVNLPRQKTKGADGSTVAIFDTNRLKEWYDTIRFYEFIEEITSEPDGSIYSGRYIMLENRQAREYIARLHKMCEAKRDFLIKKHSNVTPIDSIADKISGLLDVATTAENMEIREFIRSQLSGEDADTQESDA